MGDFSENSSFFDFSSLWGMWKLLIAYRPTLGNLLVLESKKILLSLL